MTADLTRAIDRFATALDDNSQASRQIGLAIKETERRRRRTSIAIGIAAALMFLLVGGMFLVLISITNTQNVIKDCTDRTRNAPCARDAQANTGRVLTAIADSQLAASYVTQLCAKREATEAGFTRCVQVELGNVKSGKLKVPTVG